MRGQNTMKKKEFKKTERRMFYEFIYIK